jgi:hypothetical protein
MGRPKGAKNRTNKKVNTIPDSLVLLTCSMCPDRKPKKATEFYRSFNVLHNTGRLPYCKQCLKNMCVDKDNNITIEKMSDMLKLIDRPFLYDIFKVTADGTDDVVGMYMKNIGLRQYRDLDYSASIFEEKVEKAKPTYQKPKELTEDEILKKQELEANDKKNEYDVLDIIGYDPFEGENPSDKRYLYNRLVDFLDDSTLEDSFKLHAVIEIVKSFNQIDKINQALASITGNIEGMVKDSETISRLLQSKKQIMGSVLASAKDNGISINHNNSKSKGSGTLSGIIKRLNEIDLEESQINLFDIETSEAILQVANINNRSILEQLNFDENDYTEIIKDQKKMIEVKDAKLLKLEEENRLLKLKLLHIEGDK